MVNVNDKGNKGSKRSKSKSNSLNAQNNLLHTKKPIVEEVEPNAIIYFEPDEGHPAVEVLQQASLRNMGTQVMSNCGTGHWSPDCESELAAFLCGADRHSYFGNKIVYPKTYHHSNHQPDLLMAALSESWWPQFDRPLGTPLGPCELTVADGYPAGTVLLSP
jgi:hypothetical protein